MTWGWLVAVLLLAPTVALGQTGGDFDLSWSKISVGGASVATGGSFTLAGTVAQIDAAAKSSSADRTFQLFGGFWPVDVSDLLVSVSDPGSSPTAPRFDLEGFRENPVMTASRIIRFSLDGSLERTKFDVLDLSGRLVFTRSWDALSPGEHAVDLGSELRLEPGVYWLRLTRGSSQVGRKVVILN
jgi:hypothetical protein